MGEDYHSTAFQFLHYCCSDYRHTLLLMYLCLVMSVLLLWIFFMFEATKNSKTKLFALRSRDLVINH